MRTLLKALLVGALLVLGPVGCHTAAAGSTSSAPPPIPESGSALLTPEQAAAGRALYINKCARCHKFYDPAKYSEADWNKWMTKMNKKAKLKHDEAEQVSQFLGAYRSEKKK